MTKEYLIVGSLVASSDSQIYSAICEIEIWANCNFCKSLQKKIMELQAFVSL